MPAEVQVRKGEPVDRALKRLKSKMDSEGIMDEVRRLRAYETPTQKTRRKAKANAKRNKVKFRFNPNGPNSNNNSGGVPATGGASGPAASSAPATV